VLVAGLTNKGLERPRNEDNCFVEADSGSALLAVADGMGGHRAGNVASSIAVTAAEHFWSDFDRANFPTAEKAREMIKNLIVKANEEVLNEAVNSSECKGMGTTFTAGLLCGNRLTIGHIGDSRAYLINKGQIKLLTRDHSLVEQLVESGQISPEDAENHPQKHVLTRALGISPDLQLDISEEKIENGSTLIFCTDGLTNMVRDEEILREYSNQPDPEKLAEALIKLANSRGGLDNITVVVATNIGGQKA